MNPPKPTLRSDIKASNTVGGGPKKVLHTLSTVRRMGLKNAAKALTANNACKACALGMGGQRGGMTNELDEYPSVCNKSIQAQSTDIQPPIPEEIFQHSLAELQALSPFELEHLGRLGNPIYKPKDSDRYQAVTWDWAIKHTADSFSQIKPQRSFFYSSGRSSNEAGFILQLLSRLYGTNNVNNCAYYCHQATSVGLASTLGTGVGTATIELNDLSGCDLIFILGANPASNHPRLMHKLKACRDRGGHIVMINPAKEPGLVRFAVPKSPKSMLTGGTWIASDYLQPRIGSDIALLKGIAKAIVAMGAEDKNFIDNHTQGFAVFLNDIENTTWSSIETVCGVKQAHIEAVAQRYAKSNNTVFAWGMGITHHTNGVENVEYIANLALLRGMVGKRYAGLLPLRGHSNIQGIGTMGVKPLLPQDVLAQVEKHWKIELPSTEGLDTLACLQAANNDEMDAALLLGGNLYGASPDSKWTKKALDKIGLKVFLTTTLNQGHVFGMDNSESLVLPVTARDEEWQPTTQESMFNYVRLSDGGIQRLENIRPEAHILSDIAQQLLPDSPVDFSAFMSHKKIRETIAHTIPGMEALMDIDDSKQEFHVSERVMHTPAFKNKDKQANFIVHPTSASTTQSDTYPFTLMTVRSEGQYNTIIYEEKDSYRGTDNRWSVMLNPEDMKEMNIDEESHINLISATGRMDKVRVYGFDLPQGNAMAYFPEANILVSQTSDPRSKTPAFKAIPIRIELT